MRLLLTLCLFLCCFATSAWASVSVLCYHEVDNNGPRKDVWSVSAQNLEQHILYLKAEGYYFADLGEYIAYCKGEVSLPEKTVMLTFDDGYASFYNKAYPLLKKHRVPAMLAMVTSWMDGKRPADVRALVSWEQLQEMEASGLVTVVSHTDSLHTQRVVTPQGSVGSIIQNRLFVQGAYETDAAYTRRLRNDLRYVQQKFKDKLGHKARAIVWPYGRYSGKAVAIAKEEGFESSFLLDGGINTGAANDLYFAKRMIIYNNPSVQELKQMLDKQDSPYKHMLVAQVDIDSIYDADQRIMDQNINGLLDRLYRNKVNVVVLQAFANPEGDGNVRQVYFKNDVVPVRADVFNYISMRLGNDGKRVFAWMPTLAIAPLLNEHNAVQAYDANKKGWYKRFSPFDEDAVAKAANMYEQLGQYAYVDGVLLQDDLYLNDYEDFSPAAQEAYYQKFKVALTPQVKNNPESYQQWTRWKSERLQEVSRRYIAALRQNRPEALSARNMYTAVAQNKHAEEWFAQNLEGFYKDYDYTFLMAYDYMDKRASDYESFLGELAQNVKAYDQGMQKTVFKLQTYDWQQQKWIAKEHLTAEIKFLRGLGCRHVGYYPEPYYTLNH